MKNKKKQEILLASVYSDTKTVKLLDKFEGIGMENDTVYEKIVIRNPSLLFDDNLKYIYYRLVIERCKRHNYIGDITFTAFKKGQTAELNRFIKSEISQNVLENYMVR